MVLLGALACFAACGDTGAARQPGSELPEDAGSRRDAGPEVDAGLEVDAGPTADAGAGDDAGTGSDAGVADAGPQPDLDGMPNLVIRKDLLESDWQVRRDDFAAGCDQEEYGIPPGVHPVLRFTGASANIGDADVYVGDATDPGNEGLFELSACHDHYHYLHYMEYALVEPGTGRTWSSAKRAFCLIDNERNPPDYPGPRRAAPYYAFCTTTAKRSRQGLSTGWSDVYYFSLPGQHLVLDGSDGQPAVPPGEYLLRITVNPPYTPAEGQTCRVIDDDGLCRNLRESSYDDNTAEVRVTIPEWVVEGSGTPPAPVSASTSQLECQAR